MDDVVGDNDLEQLGEMFRAFLEAAPVGVAILDRAMRYVEVSARWIKDYRLEGQTLKGRSHYDVFPEIPEHWKAIHRRCLAGETASSTDPFPRADGRVDWVQWQIRPWRRLSGAIGGIIIFSELVTDRIQIESKLRVSEGRYRVLIEEAPEAILVYDVERDRFVEANGKAVSLFGCDRSELLRVGPERFYLPEQPDGERLADSIREHNRRAIEGDPVMFERRIRNAKGVDLVCEVRLARLPSLTGRLIRASLIDITERKRIEQSLRDSELKFGTIFRDSPAGTAILGLSDGFKIVDVNQAWLDMLGFEYDEVIGRTSIELNLWVDPAGRKIMYDAIAVPPFIWSGDIRLRRKDGAIVVDRLTIRRTEIGGKLFAIAIGFGLIAPRV